MPYISPEEKTIRLLQKLLIGAVSLVLIIGASYIIHIYKYHRIDRGELIARINGTKIYRFDIASRMDDIVERFDDSITLNNIDPEILKAVLMEVYTNDYLFKQAKKSNIAADNTIKLLTHEYYMRLVKEKFLNDKIFSQIDEEAIKNKYNELVNDLAEREERKVSHILVDNKEQAERIRNLVVKYNNFDSHAKRSSLDKITAINGGDLGYVIKEELAFPELADIVFMLKKGEVSRPIETERGWHLLKVEDIRPIEPKSYEEAKGDIETMLKDEVFSKYIKGILEKAKVKIYLEQEETPSVPTVEESDEVEIEELPEETQEE